MAPLFSHAKGWTFIRGWQHVRHGVDRSENPCFGPWEQEYSAFRCYRIDIHLYIYIYVIYMLYIYIYVLFVYMYYIYVLYIYVLYIYVIYICYIYMLYIYMLCIYMLYNVGYRLVQRGPPLPPTNFGYAIVWKLQGTGYTIVWNQKKW